MDRNYREPTLVTWLGGDRPFLGRSIDHRHPASDHNVAVIVWTMASLDQPHLSRIRRLHRDFGDPCEQGAVSIVCVAGKEASVVDKQIAGGAGRDPIAGLMLSNYESKARSSHSITRQWGTEAADR